MSSAARASAPRLGVIDIGSNTVHLLVLDARYGVRPVPHAERKITVRLMRYLDADGAVTDEGRHTILAAVVAGAEELVEDAERSGRR